MCPCNNDLFAAQQHVVHPLGLLCLLGLTVGDKGIAPGLACKWTSFVEEQVEFFDFAVFLQQFKELIPICANREQLERYFTQFVNPITYSLTLESKLPIQRRFSFDADVAMVVLH